MFLGWIPIVGPIIDGIVSVFNKKQDTDLEKYKVDGQINVEAIKASTALTQSFKDDIGVRLARDLIMFPVALWCALGTWDYIIVLNHPDLVWGVKAFPVGSGLEYLPHAVLTFLFGITSMKIWKN